MTEAEELEYLRLKKRKAVAMQATAAPARPQVNEQDTPNSDMPPKKPIDIMGPHASREAALDKRMKLRQVENLKKKAARANNTTTAEDAFVGQAAQWGTSGLWDGIRASYDLAGEEGGIMKSTRDMVPVFGALPYVSDKVRAGLVGDQARKDDLEAREDVHEKNRGVAMQEHPVAGAFGSILGAAGPGALQYKAVATGARMIPGFNALADMIGGMGRTASYTGRLGTAAGGFYADSQAQGMMAGASDEAALAAASGEPQGDMTLGDRARVGQQYANFGPEVGGVQVPVSAALPVVGSIAGRSANMVRKGYATPDAIAATQANVHGRAPTRGAVPKSITETTRVLDGQIVPGDVRGIMGIENALRDALKGVQVNGKSRTAAQIDARIADGFKSIREQLPLLDDTTLNFARLIEREFSNESPQVTDTIRRFLLKVGMDTPEGGAVVQNATNRIRGQQNDVLEQEATDQFGAQSKTDAKATLRANKKLIWDQGYNQVLDQPLEAAGQAEALDRIVSRKGFLDDAARAEGVTVDDYVLRNPLKALHEVRSELGDRARNARSGGNPDYDLEDEVKAMANILDANVPGYKDLRTMYAKEAEAFDRLGTTRGAEAGPKGELGYEAGFGERLFGGTPATPGAASRAEGRATAKEVFAGMDEQSKKAAALSVRDVILDDLGKARAAGVEERYATAAKFNALRTQGALEALEDVFEDEGKAVADRVRQFIDANQFARDIDPNFNSATMNKAQAMKEGAVPFSNSIGRKLGTGVGGEGDALLGDAALVMSGNAPILSMMRGARRVPGWFQPSDKTNVKIAKTLLRQSERGGQVPPPRIPPPPINALRPEDLPGRVNTAGNALASNDSGSVTPNAASALSTLGGAGTGATKAGDIDGDGKVTWKDRVAGGAAGAAAGYGLKIGIGAGLRAEASAAARAGSSLKPWQFAPKRLGSAPRDAKGYLETYIQETDQMVQAMLAKGGKLKKATPQDIIDTAAREGRDFMDEARSRVGNDIKWDGRQTWTENGMEMPIALRRAAEQLRREGYDVEAALLDAAKSEARLAGKMKPRATALEDEEIIGLLPDEEGEAMRRIISDGKSVKSSGFGGVRGDAGNALAGGVVGGAMPADNNQDRARNIMIGAGGAGLAGRVGPKASASSAGVGGKRLPNIKSDIPLGTPAKGKTKLPKSLAEMMAEPIPMQGIAKATGDKATMTATRAKEATEMLAGGKTLAEIHKATKLVPIEYKGNRILIDAGDTAPDEVLSRFYQGAALPKSQQPEWIRNALDELDPLVLDKPLQRLGNSRLAVDKDGKLRALPKGPVRGAGFVGGGTQEKPKRIRLWEGKE